MTFFFSVAVISTLPLVLFDIDTLQQVQQHVVVGRVGVVFHVFIFVSRKVSYFNCQFGVFFADDAVFRLRRMLGGPSALIATSSTSDRIVSLGGKRRTTAVSKMIISLEIARDFLVSFSVIFLLLLLVTKQSHRTYQFNIWFENLCFFGQFLPVE